MNRCDYLDPMLPWTGHKDTGKGVSLRFFVHFFFFFEFFNKLLSNKKLFVVIMGSVELQN